MNAELIISLIQGALLFVNGGTPRDVTAQASNLLVAVMQERFKGEIPPELVGAVIPAFVRFVEGGHAADTHNLRIRLMLMLDNAERLYISTRSFLPKEEQQ